MLFLKSQDRHAATEHAILAMQNIIQAPGVTVAQQKEGGAYW